jgi:hypothetical protein
VIVVQERAEEGLYDEEFDGALGVAETETISIYFFKTG